MGAGMQLDPDGVSRPRFQQQTRLRDRNAAFANRGVRYVPRLDSGTATAAEIAAGLADPYPDAFVAGAVPIQHRTSFTAGIGASDGEEPAPDEIRLSQPRVPVGSNRDDPPTDE